MATYSKRCEGCGGEDCACCEVYLEEVADQRASANRDPREDEVDYLDAMNMFPDDDLEDDLPEDERDGDAASALASAGFGTDEDYERPDDLCFFD